MMMMLMGKFRGNIQIDGGRGKRRWLVGNPFPCSNTCRKHCTMRLLPTVSYPVCIIRFPCSNTCNATLPVSYPACIVLSPCCNTCIEHCTMCCLYLTLYVSFRSPAVTPEMPTTLPCTICKLYLIPCMYNSGNAHCNMCQLYLALHTLTLLLYLVLPCASNDYILICFPPPPHHCAPVNAHSWHFIEVMTNA